MTTPTLTPVLVQEQADDPLTAEGRRTLRRTCATVVAVGALDALLVAALLVHAPISVPAALFLGLPLLVVFGVAGLPLRGAQKAHRAGVWRPIWWAAGWVRLALLTAPLWLLFGPQVALSAVLGLLFWRLGISAVALPLLLAVTALGAAVERVQRYLDENGPRL